jgi:hypothetical protein
MARCFLFADTIGISQRGVPVCHPFQMAENDLLLSLLPSLDQ